MAPQFTVTSGASRRGLASCSAATTSSLPVPLSPLMSTVVGERAMRSMVASTSRIGALLPTIFPLLVRRRVTEIFFGGGVGCVPGTGWKPASAPRGSFSLPIMPFPPRASCA